MLPTANMLGLEDLFPQQARTEADDIAPVYEVSQRKVVAIEHPCIIKNLDRGIKSFGPNPKFQKVSDFARESALAVDYLLTMRNVACHQA